MNFNDLVQKRRSIRKFTDEPIAPEQVQSVLRAGLMSPTSKSSRAWQFVVVDDRDMLDKLSMCKSAGAEFLKGAPMAVVVLVDTDATDVWIEDASIAAVTMQYQAADLGLGSCWAQIRLRSMADGTPAENIVQFLLGIPENLKPLCILGFGHPAMERKPQNEDGLKWESVHIGSYQDR